MSSRLARRLLAFIKLVRPPNCLMIGFAVLVGAVVALGRFPLERATELAYGFATGASLLAASNALNDYYDREIDAINEPSRPIPSGLVRPWEALALAGALTVLGLFLAFLTSLDCLLLALLAALVADTYVTLGKRTGLPGNAMVSFCVAIPFLYGALIALGHLVELLAQARVLIFAAIAFLANLGREVNKGIVDMPGDAARGVKTVAVRWGARAAAYLAAAFYLAAVGLSALPPLLGLVSWAYLPFIALTDAGFTWASLAVVRRPEREEARKVKNSVLIWMTTGMLGFLAGALS